METLDRIPAFRKKLMQVFSEGLGIKFLPGVLEGPLQYPEPLGSVYVRRVQEDPIRVAQQHVHSVVRVFVPWSSAGTALNPNLPYDPEPLEEIAEKLMAVIAANQTGLGPWFQRLTSIEIDPVHQGIEAMVLAYDSNPGVAVETTAG